MARSNFQRFSLCLALSALALAPVACGDDDGDDGNNEAGNNDDTDGGNNDASGDGDSGDGDSGDGDGDGGDGTTTCGPVGTVCQAGQYCSEPNTGICENGCLNNDNCASNQVCEKASGENVGSCQNLPGDGPTQEEFCTKWNACDPDGMLPVTCEEVYGASSVACHECVIENNCNDISFEGVCDEACGW